MLQSMGLQGAVHDLVTKQQHNYIHVHTTICVYIQIHMYIYVVMVI